MHSVVNRVDNRVEVTVLADRLDVTVADRFQAHLREHLDDAITELSIDLSRVEFLDSSALAALVTLRKALGDDGTVVIRNLNRTVENLFRLTGLHRVFELEPAAAT